MSNLKTVTDNAATMKVPDTLKAPARSSKRKRYNLALPEDLFEEVQKIADSRDTTVVEVLKRFIKLGLLAVKIEENPDAALIIREGDRERQIVLL